MAKPVSSNWHKPVCCDCGQRVFTSREGFWEHYQADERWIWHLDCRPPWQIDE